MPWRLDRPPPSRGSLRSGTPPPTASVSSGRLESAGRHPLSKLVSIQLAADEDNLALTRILPPRCPWPDVDGPSHPIEYKTPRITWERQDPFHAQQGAFRLADQLAQPSVQQSHIDIAAKFRDNRSNPLIVRMVVVPVVVVSAGRVDKQSLCLDPLETKDHVSIQLAEVRLQP